MTGPKPPETATQAEYFRLLHRIAWLWMLAAVLIASVASYRYYQDASAIENIANRDISQGWTITLLWVPLILQLLVLAFLGSRVRKEKHDDAVRHYFKFFYRNTGKASTAYAALWFGYTIWIGGNADSGVILALRWISLLGIIFLIYVVVKATYLITGSSTHRAKRLFREEDLDETKINAISRKLRAAASAANGTKNPSPDAPHSQEPPVSTQVRQIHRWLLKSRDYKVHRVAYKGNLDDLDMPHLVETLNSLVSSRDFYWATQEDGQIRDEPTLHVREAANRNYIEKYFVTDPPAVADPSTKSTLGISAALTWLREVSDRLLGKQDRVDQQIGQRDGIRLFPFYTLIFFFSIFLCTAYLFAFAFAFEDKHVQLTDTKQQVALFMTDELLEDAPQQTDPALIRYSDLKNPSELVKKMRDPRDSLGQYVNVRLTPRTKDLLQKEAAFDVPSGKLVNSLIYDLNALIKQESLYDRHRFDGVKLREGTRTLLNVIPTGRELTYLNRSLLEDAYTDVFARMSEDYQLNKVQEKFFFQSGAAGLDVGANDAATNEQHFIAQINKASLDTIVQELRFCVG